MAAKELQEGEESPRAGGELIAVAEAAEGLGVTPATVRRWLKEGRIEGRKVGRGWRVDGSVLEKRIGSQGSAADESVSAPELPAAEAEAEPPAEQGEALTESSQGRERQELLVRVKELELEVASEDAQATYQDDIGGGDPLAAVKDLEQEIDAALTMRDSLRVDLAAVEEKLAEESTTRAQLEKQVNRLETRAALADQLREEVSFVDEERNEIAANLKEARAEVERLREERDSLASRIDAVEESNHELQRDRARLEAELWATKEEVSEESQGDAEVQDLTEERDALAREVRKVTGELASAKSLAEVLKQNLETKRGAVRDQRAELEQMQAELRSARSELIQLRNAAQDKDEANGQLQRELKDLTRDHEAATDELGAVRKTLLELHRASMAVRDRIRRRSNSST